MATPVPPVQIDPATQSELKARLPEQEEKELNKNINSQIGEVQQQQLSSVLQGVEEPADSTPPANADPNVGDNFGDFIERTGIIPGGPNPRPGSESANTLIALEHEKESKKLNQDFGE